MAWKDRRIPGIPNEHSTLVIKFEDQLYSIKANFFSKQKQINPSKLDKLLRVLVRVDGAANELLNNITSTVLNKEIPLSNSFEKALYERGLAPYGYILGRIGEMVNPENIENFLYQNNGIHRSFLCPIESEEDLKHVLEISQSTISKLNDKKIPFNGLSRNCHTLTASTALALLTLRAKLLPLELPLKPVGANALGSNTNLNRPVK